MSLKKRSWWNIFGLFADFLRNSVTENIPAEVKLESDAREMMTGLREMSNLVELSMSTADRKYEELTEKVGLFKTYNDQAKQFLSAGKEAEAQRCVALKMQIATDIERLKVDYKDLQADAEQKVAQFKNEKRKVEEKIKSLPQLKSDAKMIRQQDEIDRKFSTLSLDNPSSAFDETADEIKMKKLQQKNRRFLTQDPNAQLDASISRQLDQKNIDDEMNRLRKELSSVEDANFEIINENSIDDAIKLLEKPRFEDTLPSFTNNLEKEKIRVKKNDEDDSEAAVTQEVK